MAGHSKWHNIQVRKGAQDKKRSALFTKLGRDIVSAAKEGGADPATNPRLKTMIEKAKAASMPKANIDRAVSRGAGTGDAANLVAITYEGKGPGNIDILVEAATDNKNRTASDIKHLFTKNGGQLGGPGSVAWNFEQKGYIKIKNKKEKIKIEEELFELFDIAGITDAELGEDGFDIYTEPQDLMRVRDQLEKMAYEVDEVKLIMDPKNTIVLESEDLDKAVTLLEALDEYDDVEGVYTNLG